VRGLDGTVAVVTGGASGIGQAIALDLAARDVAVAVLDLQPADETMRLLGAGRHLDLRADVTSRASLERARETVEEELGEVDFLVNNAGGVPPKEGLVLDLSDEAWDRVLALNLTGPLNAMRVFCPGMGARERGAVVNIASTAASFVWPRAGHYGAAKSGLVGLSRHVAYELGPAGVRVNCVSSPATVETPRTAPGLADPAHRAREAEATALGRVAQPEDIAPVVAFLLSDEARYLTGIDLLCDAGYSLTGQSFASEHWQG
jgi:NAD(P)-dependent dehydrogenase (short-subunit alcohol dehydrogenase family)